MLRDYQIQISDKAVELLKEHKICYLSMQVRTGKTLTSIAAAEKYGAKKVLFVTRKKAITSIQDDYDTFNPSFIIDIINYEQLHNVYLEGHDLVIVDEAHCISQFPTPAERTRLLKKLCANLPIIYLSGTPTPESYSQLYHQFWISSFSPFSQWPTFYKWAGEFVTLKKKYFNNISINDYTQADKEKIDHMTKHLFISFSQEDAGFEQLVEERVVTVPMMANTHVLAKKLMRDRVYVGRNGEEVLADTNVKLMNKLHQIYSGTVILDQPAEGLVFDKSKANYIRDHFARQKIGVFYKFKAEAHMLYSVFAERITEVPEEFNDSTDKIFISQIQSGREGINLSTADCLIMLNIDYSATSYWQVRARLQTKTRTKEAIVYWLFSDGGIEHKIYKMVQAKKDYTLHHFKKDFNVREPDKIQVQKTA